MLAIKTQEQIDEIVRCYNDPWFFIERMQVRHTKRGVVPFKLYEYQKDVIHAVLTHSNTITLKPRQMGITTLLAALALWMCTFRPNSNVVIISLKASTARAFVRKVKGFYFSLPEHLRANLAGDLYKDYNRRYFGRQDYVPFANGSELQAMGSTSDAGRSESISWLIFDEVAFQKNAADIWGAAQQTLADGGIATLVSTPYGVGNFYHKVWMEAIQPSSDHLGANGFYPIKLEWRDHPERNETWYARTKKLLGTRRTAQEVDCSFINSGNNVFDVSKLRAIEERLEELEPVRHEVANGVVLQYYQPEAGVEYVIGADIATGLKSGDYSTFSIMTMTGKEVACYKGKITTAEFAKLLARWGILYNGAWLAPETNGVGEGVIAALQLIGYDKIFHHVDKILKEGQYEHGQSLIAGWITTGKTRSQIINGLDEDISDELVEINNPYFVAEAWSFVYDNNNKPVALGKHSNKSLVSEDDNTNSHTDDAIFSVCIANEVRKSIKASCVVVPPSSGSCWVREDNSALGGILPFTS